MSDHEEEWKRRIGETLTGPEVLNHVWSLLTPAQRDHAFGWIEVEEDAGFPDDH